MTNADEAAALRRAWIDTYEDGAETTPKHVAEEFIAGWEARARYEADRQRHLENLVQKPPLPTDG